MLNVLIFSILWLINIVSVVFKKKSNLIAIITIIYFSIVFAYTQTSAGDAYTYKTVYSNSFFLIDRFEAGYMIYSRMFYNIGFTFEQFRLITLLICFSLIYQTVKQYTTKFHCIISLYAVILLYFNTVVIRYFIAFSIIIYAFRFLLKKKIIFLLIYGLLVGLAMTFHNSAIFAFVFYIVALPEGYFLKTIKVLKIVGIILFGYSLIVLIQPNFIRYVFEGIAFIAKLIDLDERLYRFINYTYSRNNFLIAICFLSNMAITSVARRYISDNNPNELVRKVLNLSLGIDIISMVLIPALIMNVSITRYFFFSLMIGYIILAMSLDENNIKEEYKFWNLNFDRNIFIFLIVCSSGLWYYTIMGRHIWQFDFWRAIAGAGF